MNSSVQIKSVSDQYNQQVAALERGCFKDPFSFLGVHTDSNSKQTIRCFLPGAQSVCVKSKGTLLNCSRYMDSDLFIAHVTSVLSDDYELIIEYADCTVQQRDIYNFPSALDTHAMYLFNEGTLEHAYRHLGAHFISLNAVEGVRFSVWAPNASSVSVIGEFNHWQRNQHFMRFN